VGKNQRVYVIGHPRGGGLSYSLNDNLLLDHERPRVHYRAPTEGGSSGSPIFNQQWDLIALHHAGGTEMKMLNGKPGTYPANEGLDFQSIREAVAKVFG
jgi:V8-like Glu-specific endopeptidase